MSIPFGKAMAAVALYATVLGGCSSSTSDVQPDCNAHVFIQSGATFRGRVGEALATKHHEEVIVRKVGANCEGVNGVKVEWKGQCTLQDPLAPAISYTGTWDNAYTGSTVYGGVASIPMWVTFEEPGICSIEIFVEGDYGRNPTWEILDESDQELSHITLGSHETDLSTGLEFPGDALDDDNLTKDLWIELDVWDQIADDQGMIDSLKNTVVNILASIGIHAHFTDGIDALSLNNLMTVHDTRLALAASRTEDRDSVIHLVVATRDAGWAGLNHSAGVCMDYYGATRLSQNQEPKYSIFECWAFGTGDYHYVRDSMGCVVFYKTIKDEYDENPFPIRWNYNVGTCLGVVAAHEIGHALGLKDHDNDSLNVMSDAPEGGFGDAAFDNRLENFYHFWPDAVNDGPSPENSFWRNAVNCRDVVGLHTAILGIGWAN